MNNSSFEDVLDRANRIEEQRVSWTEQCIISVLSRHGITDYELRFNEYELRFDITFTNDKQEFLYNLRGKKYYDDAILEEFMSRVRKYL